MKTIHYPSIEKIEPVNQMAGKVTAKVWGDGMLNVHKERRAYDRVHTSMEARFFCGNRYYAGKRHRMHQRQRFRDRYEYGYCRRQNEQRRMAVQVFGVCARACPRCSLQYRR